MTDCSAMQAQEVATANFASAFGALLIGAQKHDHRLGRVLVHSILRKGHSSAAPRREATLHTSSVHANWYVTFSDSIFSDCILAVASLITSMLGILARRKCPSIVIAKMNLSASDSYFEV